MTPEDTTTLIELLAWRADVSAARTAFTFQGHPCTFEELWRGANDVGSMLQTLGVERQECVLVVLPNGRDFFFAFYGVQRAGGVAVPVFPGSTLERIRAIAESCDARLMIAPTILEAGVARLAPEVASHGNLTVFQLRGPGRESRRTNFPTIEPDDLAFLQYTSGSTGDPKGVMLTHADLLTNVRQMIAGMEITRDEIFVSWLPVYHDMGLILKTMVPFYLGAESHLLPTNLRDVRLWLQTIQLRRATFTAAPDFAYRLALSRVEQNPYDLSSLRVALNAAEPVRAGTIEAFEERFGLGPVMTAGYGLAEATVGVSMSQPGRRPDVDDRGIVSVGRPFPGIEIRVMEDGKILPPGQIGEIFIKSPANSRGYYNHPEATAALFQEGFLASGDLGYTDTQGKLYITGRSKNLIKHLGRSVAGQELEEIVDAIPGVRFSAAVGIDRGRLEGEQVYLFVVLRGEGSRNSWEELTLQIVEAVYARLGLRPARVVFLKPQGIPRTHNGKVQHVRLREQYLSGQLRDAGRILYPAY